jgi:hypothetical protein
MSEAKSGSGRAGLCSAGRGLATGFCAPETDGACLFSDGAVVWNVGWTVSNASMPAVYDWANGLGFAGLLRFSDTDPLRADAVVESLLGVKLNDGVLAGFGGGGSGALEDASEVVVVGAWGKKLGVAFCCFVPSSGFANGANEVLGALAASVFGAAKENAGSADVFF